MSPPLVSVVIPAYNGADAMGDAIQSVLAQTYARIELLVADDCSTDGTRDVVRSVADPRVRLLTHATNQGPDAARRTALDASSGDIIAYLDQDDLFLPGKIEAHVRHLAAHPQIGLTYNSFFVTTEPGQRVQLLSRPPEAPTLADLVCGFPLPPSTWVLRRRWAVLEDIWDPRTMLRGREVVILGRLLVSGCRFSLVDQALNHRRIHPGRRFGSPASKCAEERRCQSIVLDDPRCAVETGHTRLEAEVNAWLVWANVALAQGETESGLAMLRHALRLRPELSGGDPNRLAEYFLGHAVVEAEDAEDQLTRIVRQVENEVPGVSSHLGWAVTQAHLIQGARHVIWGRPDEAARHWARLKALRPTVDDHFLRRIAHEILGIEQTLGAPQALDALSRLAPPLAALGGAAVGRRLKGTYRIMRAFHNYGLGERDDVPVDVLRGMAGVPQEAANRGAWSILLRSAVRR
jgi:glycosyltransferase involved in cell wall biosynthesis